MSKRGTRVPSCGLIGCRLHRITSASLKARMVNNMFARMLGAFDIDDFTALHNLHDSLEENDG